MNFLTKFFGLTKNVSIEQLKNITLLFWSGVIFIISGEMAILIGAASNSGSVTGVMPYLATATVAFPLLLVVALHWGLMRGLLALGYGGEKPQEAFTQGWSNAVRVIAVLAFANIVAIAPLLILSVQHVIPAYLSLILILIGIGIGAVAHGVTTRALWRIGLLFLVLVMTALVATWVSPEFGHKVHNTTAQSPALTRGRAGEAAIVLHRKEKRLQMIAGKVTSCNMTVAELARRQEEDCSVSQGDLTFWNAQEEPVAKASKRLKGLTNSLLEKSDPPTKSTARVQRSSGNGKCEPVVSNADSGDEITISFPNCYSGKWEHMLPDGDWKCDFDKDAKVRWTFKDGMTRNWLVAGQPSLKKTDEFTYPLGDHHFGLNVESDGTSMFVQWNVRTSKKESVSDFWRNQSSSATVRCTKS